MDPLLPWYESAIIRQQVVQMANAFFILLGISTSTLNVDGTVGAVFGAISAATAVWTLITRLRKPTPPITYEAAQRLSVELRKLHEREAIEP